VQGRKDRVNPARRFPPRVTSQKRPKAPECSKWIEAKLKSTTAIRWHP
jgi:hypothetical protein